MATAASSPKLLTQALPRDVQDVLYKAQRAIEAKDYQSAGTILQKYIHKHKERSNFLVYFTLGNAFYLEGQLKSAYQAYASAYHLESRFSPLCTNFATVCYELKKYGQAGELFESAYKCAEKPGEELLYQAAICHRQAKDFTRVKNIMERLLNGRGKATPAEWLECYVNACLELQDWQQAEQMVVKLLDSSPADRKYWLLLAQLRAHQKKFAAAATAFAVAYTIKIPGLKEWEELAGIYRYIHVPGEAAKCLERAYGKDPSAAQCDTLAAAYLRAGRLDKALGYVDRAIEKEPSASRYYEKGNLYYRCGQWRLAIEALRSALELQPTLGFAHLLLGSCALAIDDVSLAVEAFNDAAGQQESRNQALASLAVLEDLTAVKAQER